MIKKNKEKVLFPSRKNNNGNTILIKAIISGLFLVWITNLNMFIILDILKMTHLCPYTTNIYFFSIFIFIIMFLIILLSNPSVIPDNSFSKYRNSRSDESIKNTFFNKLIQCMQDQKPYFNLKLNLVDLSKMLSIPNRDLSQIINQKMTASQMNQYGHRYEACTRCALKYKLYLLQVCHHSLLGL